MKTALLHLCLMASMATLHAMDPILIDMAERPVMPPAATAAVPAAPSKELLPPDAREIVTRCEQETAAIRKDAGKSIRELRSRLVASLKELQDRYTRDAKLDEAVAIRDSIRMLPDAEHKGRPDPGSLYAYNNCVGRTGFFRVTGANTGSVWGTDTYTTDSHLATAAVHSGALKMGQTGTVKVTILQGQSSYQGSTRNGITSYPWSTFPASYKVEPLREGDESDVGDPLDLPLQPPVTTPPPEYLSGRILSSHLAWQDGDPVLGSSEFILRSDRVGEPAVVTPAAGLPDDARQLVERFKTDSAAIEKSAVQKVLRVRRDIIAELNPLLTRYTKEGELDAALAIRGHIRALKEPMVNALPDPGALYNYTSKSGGVFYFRITGRRGGTIWGTDTYTLDSLLAVAAVHAGVVKEEQTKVVKVTILPGQSIYQGSTRNGITSLSYASYPGSYKVESAEDEEGLDPQGRTDTPAATVSGGTAETASRCVVLSGAVSGVVAAQYLRVTNEAEWKTLWDRHADKHPKIETGFPVAEMPAVDFRHLMVIAIFGGATCNTHGLAAVECREERDRLVVGIDWLTYQTQGKVDKASPYGFIILPLSAKAITINHDTRGLPERANGLPPQWQPLATIPELNPGK